MVPPDPISIATAIDAALVRLDSRVASDGKSVAASRGLPSHVRHAGLFTLDALRQSIDEAKCILRGLSRTDLTDRSVT